MAKNHDRNNSNKKNVSRKIVILKYQNSPNGAKNAPPKLVTQEPRSKIIEQPVRQMQPKAEQPMVEQIQPKVEHTVGQIQPKAAKQFSVKPKKEKAKKAKRPYRVLAAFGILLCLILLPIIAANLILIIKGYVNKNEVPSLFSISPMYVMTGSMEPEINEGDLIFVQKVASADIVVEDVIAFFDPESMESAMIVHRVKEISTDEAGNLIFRTMGDANNVYDNFIISSENVVGRYVFRLRGMGRVAMFMQSTYGLIISVSIPLIMLMGHELIRQLIYYKKEQMDSTEA